MRRRTRMIQPSSRLLSRCLLSLTLLALAPARAHAQAPAAGDPLTGVWTGYIGRSAANPNRIRFELTMQPDGTLSGRASGPNLSPGVLERGTFDRATGALKFTVVIHEERGGQGGSVLFDGRVVHDTASGTLALGNERGVFRLVRGEAAAERAAPPSPTGDAGAAVRRGLVELSDWLTRAADMVPAERYAYRPTGSVRTFAQLVAHVVDGSNYYCGRAAGRSVQWSDETEKNVVEKAALVQALAKALGECKSVYEGVGNIGPMMENLVHNGLHYGNMVTYLRMMGLTPPSS